MGKRAPFATEQSNNIDKMNFQTRISRTTERGIAHRSTLETFLDQTHNARNRQKRS
jgi:hypothetical protein